MEFCTEAHMFVFVYWLPSVTHSFPFNSTHSVPKLALSPHFYFELSTSSQGHLCWAHWIFRFCARCVQTSTSYTCFVAENDWFCNSIKCTQLIYIFGTKWIERNEMILWVVEQEFHTIWTDWSNQTWRICAKQLLVKDTFYVSTFMRRWFLLHAKGEQIWFSFLV